jgi:thiamine-phosphate pyrophosphorylase
MWRLIGITLPQYEDSKAEKQRIISLLESKKIEYFHIRKPDFSFEQMSDWLKDLPLEIRKRLCLHDCIELAKEFQIGGIHLNARNNYTIPSGYEGRISVSCHSLSEIKQWKTKTDYLFLSPIYNSISKKGYEARFTKEELKKAVKEGLIDENVFALSGIEPSKFPELKEIGFSAAAIMGFIWQTNNF